MRSNKNQSLLLKRKQELASMRLKSKSTPSTSRRPTRGLRRNNASSSSSAAAAHMTSLRRWIPVALFIPSMAWVFFYRPAWDLAMVETGVSKSGTTTRTWSLNSIQLDASSGTKVHQASVKAENVSQAPHYSKQAKGFYDNHCEVQNPLDWWPQLEERREENWKLRTPSFLLIGASRSGTTSLWAWLNGKRWSIKSPDGNTVTSTIVQARAKELEVFMPKQFPKEYWRGSPSTKVQVDAVRNELWNQVEEPLANGYAADEAFYYPFYSADLMQRRPESIAFEATPDYMLFSIYSRIPILCTFPWVKLLVVLRDPVERTISDYNSLHQEKREQRQHMANLAAMVQMDITRLQSAGVLQKSVEVVPPPEGHVDPLERQAWWKYQRAVKDPVGAMVGRSLYALQLEEWYDALRSLGRDPKTQILVLRSEDLRTKPSQLIDEILTWLGDGLGESSSGSSSRSQAGSAVAPKDSDGFQSIITRLTGGAADDNSFEFQMETDYPDAPPVSAETREELRKLYEPYNERLYKLLGWQENKRWQYS